MAKLVLKINLSYSQLCIFLSSLAQPFNDWSDRHFTQGFSWRNGSVSFKSIAESGEHKINLFVDEPVPELDSKVVRAFKVPFEIYDGNIEIASITDSASLDISSGAYILQVEFLATDEKVTPEVNIRLNKGASGFVILKADEEIDADGDFDLNASPAI